MSATHPYLIHVLKKGFHSPNFKNRFMYTDIFSLNIKFHITGYLEKKTKIEDLT